MLIKIVAAGLGSLLACTAALAAPASGPVPTKVAEAAPAVQPAAAAADEEDAAVCNRSRRRLWVEGEGWIVRRITVCR